jgi:di/tricarboxylate transporter
VLGVLTPREALAGFGNPAVVTVAGLFVVSRALVASGAVTALGSILQRLSSGGERQALLAMAVVVGICSALMNNTPVVVVFLPMVLAVAADLSLAPSRLLIPLSYVTILGGCCTLIGTSTTVLVSGEVERTGRAPIAFFEPLPFGIVCVAAGTLYLVAFGPRLLPVRRTVTSTDARERLTEYATEVRVLAGSPLAGRTVEEAFARPHPDLVVIEVVRSQEILWPGSPDVRLQQDDVVLVRGRAEAVAHLGTRGGAELLPELRGEGVRSRDVTLAEVVVTSASPLVGRSVRDATARALQGSTVMAVERRGAHLRTGIADLVLREGDTLLVQTEASRLAAMRGSDDFVLLEGLHEKLVLERKAPVVLAIALAVMLLASFEVVEIAFLALGAAVALVVTGCLPLLRAYRALELPTLALMGGMMAIGAALEKSGTARLAAEHMMDLTRTLVPPEFAAHASLAACYLLANAITAFASNAAAALLVLPIALNAATSLGVNDRPFVLAVAFAASLDFATPTGYQTNLLVYGPGGYRYVDYVKVGLPLNVLLFLLAALLLPVLYPF